MKTKKEILTQAITEGIIVKMALNGLYEAFKLYGIEGTELKIKELYKNTPKLRDIYLGFYNRTIIGELK